MPMSFHFAYKVSMFSWFVNARWPNYVLKTMLVWQMICKSDVYDMYPICRSYVYNVYIYIYICK